MTDDEQIKTLVGIPPKELASLRAEVEWLRAENAALREGWKSAFNEGVRSGMKEHDSWNGGVTWTDSKSKQRLEQIGKGEG